MVKLLQLTAALVALPAILPIITASKHEYHRNRHLMRRQAADYTFSSVEFPVIYPGTTTQATWAPTGKPELHTASILSGGLTTLMAVKEAKPTSATSKPGFDLIGAGTSTTTSTSASPTISGVLPVRYGQGTVVKAPTIVASGVMGACTNNPQKLYLKQNNPPAITLDTALYSVGANGDLSTKYGLSLETGILSINGSNYLNLSPLTQTPHLSRDGGKGGYLNGQRIFVFCDTGSYSPPNGGLGQFLGFVGSSVAIDWGFNGATGKALSLQDGIGQWSDNVGRMRGFSQLTDGEQSYNLKLQGQGYRYAVWPESSIIPLTVDTALLFSPIIYLVVDMGTGAHDYTYTGNTVLSVTADGWGGPKSQRIVDKLFQQNEPDFGCLAGLRSWGPSGIGGTDGRLYLIGNTGTGLLLSRVDATKYTDRTQYQYWNGKSWDSNTPSSSSTAYMVAGAYMDGDIFYSPMHLTFVLVYLTPYADNTFYYRFLNASSAIRPASATGQTQWTDYAEALTQYTWSDQKVLFKAPAGPNGEYIYAGGVQLGYFGTEDIANGGANMMLSWTVPTGQNSASEASEYKIMTAGISLK